MNFKIESLDTKKNKRVSLLFILALLVCMPMTSFAGNYQGNIKNVFAKYNKVYIKLENGTAKGSCGNGDSFSIDPVSDYGKAMIAIALTAKTTGKIVYASGEGTCAVGSPFSGGSEILSGLDLKG